MHRPQRVFGASCLSCKTRNSGLCSSRAFSILANRQTRSLHEYRPMTSICTRRTFPFFYSYLGWRLLSTNSTTKDEERRSRFLTRAKWLNVIMATTVLGGLTYFLYFRNAEMVPETGRWRKMNISPKAEAKLGEDAYFSLISQHRDAILPEYHPTTLHVREIVNAILQANDLGTVASDTEPVPGFNEEKSPKARRWRLAVVADESIPNSTASTGGIIVFTGLLSLCTNEDELAAVLGHEIAHVVARHLAERYSKAKDYIMQILRSAGPLPANGPDVQRRAAEEFKQLMSSNLLVQELEADEIGLQLTARACFDPRAAITVNQRLATFEKRFRLLHPEFKPTHPCSEERIKKLEHLLPKAYDTISKNPRCSGWDGPLGG